MTKTNSPHYTEQLDRLTAHGEQFSQDWRDASRQTLPAVLTKADQEPAMYDAHILPLIGSVVCPDQMVYRSLRYLRPEQDITSNPRSFIRRLMEEPGLIMGFSGYGTPGYEYGVERRAITDIFDMCKARNVALSRVVDGGTGYGVPGLAGWIAQDVAYQHETVGFVPLRGLRGVVPRKTVVVSGEEFGDEAPTLGGAPDVLMLLGGQKNAYLELKTALELGSLVVALNLKTYPDDSAAYYFQHDALAREAHEEDRLIVCRDMADVSALVTNISTRVEQLQQNRAQRQQHLRKVLAPIA